VKPKSYICVGALSYLSCARQLLSENGFICFAIKYNLCRVGFSGSPECPTGVLKAVFLVCQKKNGSGFAGSPEHGRAQRWCVFPGKNRPWISGSPERLTSALKVLFSWKMTP